MVFQWKPFNRSIWEFPRGVYRLALLEAILSDTKKSLSWSYLKELPLSEWTEDGNPKI